MLARPRPSRGPAVRRNQYHAPRDRHAWLNTTTQPPTDQVKTKRPVRQNRPVSFNLVFISMVKNQSHTSLGDSGEISVPDIPATRPPGCSHSY